MAHPIGMPSEQLPDGNWVGMTPQGIQRAIGSSYMNEGIVPGTLAPKARGTTGWSYTIPGMTVFQWTAKSARRGILIPIEETTLPVGSPSGAARTDTIYVSTDGVPRVAQGATSAPGVIIDRMAIPAGASNTQGAVSTWDTEYAIPAGASLGRLAAWEAPAGPGTTGTVFTKRFVVPTDRLIRVDLTVTLASIDAWDEAAHNGHAGYTVGVDSGWARSLSCYHWSAWRTYSGTWTAEVPAGTHTVTVRNQNNMGPGWKLAGGSSTTEMNLWDAGVAV